jgi:signal transduction histidine kinase
METPEYRLLTVKDILERMVQQYQMTYGDTGDRIYELHFESEDFMLSQEKFVRIMNNLLSNATKYCPKGSIIVQVLEDNNYYKITVKDSGYGIPKEKLDLIFYKRQISERQQPGLGVGLNIVQHLVESLNGTIEVASEIGIGTFFNMKFPKTIKIER